MAVQSGNKADATLQRDSKGRFLPNNSSGCGHGRPRVNPEAKEILKAATPEAARTLVELLKSKRENIRFMAAQEILNRTQGKPETMNKLELINGNEQIFKLQWAEQQEEKTTN